MNVDIYIEGEKIELFKDETISITQGVQNVKDISKLFADFSQSFTVPASDVNNGIFKHYYNADIDGGFDARTRKDAAIYINTLDFKRGKIQLNSVQIKNGEPSNYRITFYGDVIKIKDLLGDDKLFDLTWLSNFDHDYSGSQVETGLTTGLDFTVDSVDYDTAIIYPLISYKRQYLYNSDPTDTTSTDLLVNIAYDAGRTDGVDFTELKPAIKLSVIMQAIKEKYGLNFTGAFFDSQQFNDLYMNLNNSTESLANGRVEVATVSGTFSNDYILWVKVWGTVTPHAGFETIPYTARTTINGQVEYETINPSGLIGTDTTSTGNVDYSQVGGDYEVIFEVFSDVDFEFDANLRLEYYTPTGGGYIDEFDNTYLNNVIGLDTIVTEELQDIKIYDWLTSLFKMFNLVVVPDGTDLYVQDLVNWYAEGQIYDITPFIDTKKEGVDKGKIFNQINFKFEESEQILADFFNRNNKRVYGNIEQRLYEDAAQTIPLDGDSLDVELIFEQPIFERLYDLDDNSQTSVQYCLYLDRDLKTIEGNPFLIYAPSTSVSSNPIGFKGTSTYTEISGNVFMPSHAIQIDNQSFNINFNAEFNEYTSTVFPDTIYKRYYEDYISDIFSIKRRMYDFKSILPYNLLHNLKLNDRLVIKNRRYIINSIVSNLTEREDRLELLNDIYDAPLASDVLNTSVFRLTQQTYNPLENSDTLTYIGIDNQTANKVDTGDGTTWVTVTQPKSVGTVSNIAFTVDANTTGADRTMQLKITDNIKNPVFTIYQIG